MTQTVIESKEKSLLVVLEAERFANLVHNRKQVCFPHIPSSISPLLNAVVEFPLSTKVVVTGHGVATGTITLVQHVENLQRANPGVSVTLVVEGMELYLRYV